MTQEELDKYTSHLSRSSKVFRRLYDDAGYWLNKYGSADKFVAIGKAVLDAKLVYSDRGVEDHLQVVIGRRTAARYSAGKYAIAAQRLPQTKVGIILIEKFCGNGAVRACGDYLTHALTDYISRGVYPRL